MMITKKYHNPTLPSHPRACGEPAPLQGLTHQGKAPADRTRVHHKGACLLNRWFRAGMTQGDRRSAITTDSSAVTKYPKIDGQPIDGQPINHEDLLIPGEKNEDLITSVNLIRGLNKERKALFYQLYTNPNDFLDKTHEYSVIQEALGSVIWVNMPNPKTLAAVKAVQTHYPENPKLTPMVDAFFKDNDLTKYQSFFQKEISKVLPPIVFQWGLAAKELVCKITLPACTQGVKKIYSFLASLCVVLLHENTQRAAGLKTTKAPYHRVSPKITQIEENAGTDPLATPATPCRDGYVEPSITKRAEPEAEDTTVTLHWGRQQIITHNTAPKPCGLS